MQLDPAPPDLLFPRLKASLADLRFSFGVKRAALGPYIIQKWGWDDDYQLAVHTRHFEKKPFCAIEHRGSRVGTISCWEMEGFIRLGEFYLFPSEQRNGLGTRILTHCLQIADSRRLPVRLEYLKWNPVGALYRRHGFGVTGETEIHWLMERPVPASGD